MPAFALFLTIDGREQSGTEAVHVCDARWRRLGLKWRGETTQAAGLRSDRTGQLEDWEDGLGCAPELLGSKASTFKCLLGGHHAISNCRVDATGHLRGDIARGIEACRVS